MISDAVQVGRSYAYRQKLSRSEPFVRVKAIDKVGRKGMVKIRFEGGAHPGLEEYVRCRNIIVPWGRREAVLRDEKREAALLEHNRQFNDPAIIEAASLVLESTGEDAFVAEKGGEAPAAALQRIIDRAGLEVEPTRIHRLAYRDLQGWIQLPIDAAEELARSFAAAEPETVVRYIDDREQQLVHRGNAPGDRYLHDRFRELSPAFALARQWAGLKQEAEILRKEISRLRSLVSSAAHELKAAGKDRSAARLRRALDGR